MSGVEEAGTVRREDSFDAVALAGWLEAHADPAVRPLLRGTPEVRQFPGGASNLTYLLRYPAVDLVLRRPPGGHKAAGAHDMAREYRIQQALRPVFGRVPRMVAHAEDLSVIGSEFYVMEKVEGAIPRRDLPFALSPAQTSDLCRDVFTVLADLHSLDPVVAGLAELGKGSGYVARQVTGWTGRLENSRTDDLGDWSPITDWLAAHQPDDVGNRLIHNDFRMDNLVFSDPGRTGRAEVVAVLDWEMATLGDPLMDLGGALAYWVSDTDDEFFRAFRRQPSNAPGMWTREEIVEFYCARTGFDPGPGGWRFYEVFGLFRLAVIAQQIWYRYVHRQTSNEAFAVFGPAVDYLWGRCRRLIDEER